jgi:hypothetical protein
VTYRRLIATGNRRLLGAEKQYISFDIEGLAFFLAWTKCREFVQMSEQTEFICEICFINLGCVIDLEKRRVTLRNFFDVLIPLNIIGTRGTNSCNAVALKLPEIRIQVDSKAAGAPYQCTEGHTIPHRLSEKVDAEVAKEIDEGHLEEVEYHVTI